MSPLRLAWLDFSRNRSASLPAVLILGLIVGTGGLLHRLNRLAESRFEGVARAGEAVVGAKAGRVEAYLGSLNLEGPYPGFIPYRLYSTLLNQERIGQGDGFSVATPFHRGLVPFLFCAKYLGYRVIGTTSAFYDQPEPAPKASLAQGRLPAAEGEVVLGAYVAARERLEVGEEIGVEPWVSDNPADHSALPRRLKVSGILAPMGNAWDRALYTEMTQARRLLEAGGVGEDTPWGSMVLHYVIVHLLPDGMRSLRSIVDQRTVAQATDVEEARRDLENLAGTGRKAGLLAAALLLAMGGLAIVGISAGRWEAGARTLVALKAIGYGRRDILALALWQGLFVGAASLMIGVMVDGAALPAVRAMMGAGLPPAATHPSPLLESWPVWTAALACTLGASAWAPLRLLRVHPRNLLQELS